MTLFAMDKCSYSHSEGLHTPFRTRGIGGNKLLLESSDQTLSFRVNRGSHFVEVGSEMRGILGYME